MSTATNQSVMGATPIDLAGWRACAADLHKRQAQQADERGALAERRQMFVLAAARGDTRAQKRIEQLAGRELVLDLESQNLSQALARAQAEIAAAEALQQREDRADAVRQHEAHLAARLNLVADIERHLREISPKLAALSEATRDVMLGHLALGGTPASLPTLASETVGGRLAEFMTGIGFADWLPLARPEIRPAMKSWAEAEAAAQESYRIAI